MWQAIKPEGEVPAKRPKQTKHSVCASCTSRPVFLHPPPHHHLTAVFIILCDLPWAPCPPAFPCIALSQARARRFFVFF